MSDGVFNVAKGRVNEITTRMADNDPADAALVLVLLKEAEGDGTLEDYDSLGDILSGSNTEADFTNYSRISLDDSDVSAPSPDDSNDSQASDIEDQTWTDAGGSTNNTLVKLLICYDSDTTGGDDSDIVPLCHYDFSVTTDGNDLIAAFSTDGFYQAS